MKDKYQTNEINKQLVILMEDKIKYLTIMENTKDDILSEKLLQKIGIIDNQIDKNYRNTNNLNKSFMITSNNITKSIFKKEKINKKSKYTLFIRKSKIIFRNYQKKFKSELFNENITIKIFSNNNFIITNTNLIFDYNDKQVLKKLSLNKKIYLNMDYSCGNLIVRLGQTYFNIITIFFEHLFNIINNI